jgi:hypothetical protein
MSGANITAESVRKWTSEKDNEKTLHTSLILEGELKERNQTWIEKWSIQWDTECMTKLEESLQKIHWHVHNRGTPLSGNRREASVQALPWLKVGWVDEAGKFYGYITVSKNSQVMTSQFEHLDGLMGLRSALHRACSQ